MTKQTSHRRAHTRAVLLATVAVTNIVSFVVGVSAAGHIAITRSSTAPVAAETRSPVAAARTKAARAATLPKTAAPKTTPHALAAAATASVRAGQRVEPAPIPIAGKGMWIYEFDKAGRGNPRWIVNAAVQRGLTHIYVRAGSSKVGLAGWPNIAKILPVAHKAGLKVIAWDFPYLYDPGADVRRARWILRQTVQGGHAVDGFAADVETRSEGTILTRQRARNYATWLRKNSRGKFIILVPPRPNHYTTSFYPYDILVPRFDAVAPMVYWGSQAPAEATAWAVGYLAKWGKPVAPIGQSFDMGPEGGPKGHPSGRALVHFMNEAQRRGAIGVSFWSWQHTPRGLWHTIDTYHWPARPGRQ
jgi:hypothetical protein